jgi:hypothetical protein
VIAKQPFGGGERAARKGTRSCVRFESSHLDLSQSCKFRACVVHSEIGEWKLETFWTSLPGIGLRGSVPGRDLGINVGFRMISRRNAERSGWQKREVNLEIRSIHSLLDYQVRRILI